MLELQICKEGAEITGYYEKVLTLLYKTVFLLKSGKRGLNGELIQIQKRILE